MKRSLWIIAAALLLPAATPAQPLHLDRDAAVRMALERNETHRSAMLESDRISGQYLEARAGALPTLTLEGDYMRNLELPTSIITFGDSTIETTFGTKNDYRLALKLRQPLYSAGKLGAALKIARYADRMTKADIESSRHATATAADRAYLDAIAATQAVRVYQEAENLADSNLAVVEELNAQGQVSEFDLLRAQVDAANARPPRISAENNARLAYDHLRNTLALDPAVELILDTAIAETAIPALDVDALVAEALSQRPELASTRERVGISRKMVDVAKAGFKPTVSLSSSLQWQGISDEFTPESNEWYRSWNTSINLTWPIFSGFATVGQIRQARVDLHQTELAESRLKRQIGLEVRKAHGDVQEAGQRVAALGRTVQQAERGVQIAQVRFQNGIGTQLELFDARVALTSARVNRISALHDLAVATSELRRATGRPWAPQW